MKNSTLRSFSFCEGEELSEEFLIIVSNFVNTTVGGVPVLDYAVELLDAFEEGRINSKTNIIAFVRGIQDNTIKLKCAEQNKSKSIIFDDNEKECRDGGVGQNILPVVEDAYEDLMEEEELIWAVNKVNELHQELIVNEGIDLIVALKRARDGFPLARTSLKEICEEIEIVKKVVYIILNSGKALDTLFPQIV